MFVWIIQDFDTKQSLPELSKSSKPLFFPFWLVYKPNMYYIDNARPPKTAPSIGTFRPYEQKRTKGNAHQELIARTKNNFHLGALDFLNPV